MFRIILTKIAAGLLTTLGVSIVIFLGTNALPGDADKFDWDKQN